MNEHATNPRPAFTTQSDVAQHAGVSLMTVQRALSGHPHVAERTRRRIERAAAQLGYRPNAAARSTRTGRTGCLSLLLSNRVSRSIVSGAMLHGIQQALRPRDLHLLIEEMPDDKLTDAGYVPKMLRELMSDGLLINYNARIPQRMIDLLRKSNLPSVWLNSKQDADCVYPDDHGAAVRITEHLLALGHTRVGYVDFTHSLSEEPWHYSGVDRYRGYADTMADAGLTPRRFGSREELADGLALDAALNTLRRDDRPTAVVAYVGRGARIMFTAAKVLGLRVPDDLSIATFESRIDQEMGLSLTTMQIPEGEVGQRAASLLLDKLEDPAGQTPPIAVPCKLTEGQTCAEQAG